MSNVIYLQDFESEDPIYGGELITDSGNKFGRSRRVNGSSNIYALQLEPVSVKFETDKVYTVSFDYRFPSPNELERFYLEIHSGEGGNIIPYNPAGGSNFKPTTSWEKGTIKFTPKKDADKITIIFKGTPHTDNSYDIDNISISYE